LALRGIRFWSAAARRRFYDLYTCSKFSSRGDPPAIRRHPPVLPIRGCLTLPPSSHKITYKIKKSHAHFKIVLRPEPKGGFTVIVPALPGCVTYGRTLAEAKKMAKDAISGYVASLRQHNEPIPAVN
jgi:predicted RNase H-like HicB family nuclease